MNIPICFTQFFVDKQNVRSYGNVFRVNLLQEKNQSKLALHIFREDPSLVSILSAEILELINILKLNLHSKSKENFKSYFLIGNQFQSLEPVDKSQIFDCCCSALMDLIPNDFFLNHQNKVLFYGIVKSIIYGMKRQHIQIDTFLKKWKYSVSPLKLPNDMKYIRILYCILLWILQDILPAILCLNFYVTACKLDSDEYKLFYFWKHQWQSFYDQCLHNMMKNKVIKKLDSISVGRRTKIHFSFNSRVRLRLLRRNIPKLHLVLKGNKGYRPIIRYKSEIPTVIEKDKLRNINYFLKLITGESRSQIQLQYKTIYLKWMQMNKPKLYFIKTDLSNAFGSVNRNALLCIVQEKYQKYLKTEKNAQLIEKNHSIYKEVIKELKKNILIRAGSTIFEWSKGLVQGYKFSPALSELYYKYFDEIYFAKHLERPRSDEIKLFIRVVDDYLYITNNLDDAHSFLKALVNYRNVNYDKTFVNFLYPNIKYCKEITYLGYCYDTAKMQVSRADYAYSGQMCYKISFNDSIDNLYRFLESRIGQSSIKINGHIFNFIYNTENLVWQHIFTTFCLSANKFCTILAMLCDTTEMYKFIDLYKKKVTVKLSNTIIEVLMKNKPEDFLFMYCINHFRYISWLALSLCVKNTPKCSNIYPYVKNELAKTNCVLGKWREHACRIDTNGNMEKSANRHVCTRTDLRVIMKKFHALPKGFQCFNHKLIYK